eukprot:gene22267-28381_t
MRSTNTIKDIVIFLCTWAKSALGAARKDVADRALLCLSEMVGWIDVFLVLQDALPTIYAMFQDKRTRASATACLLELVKKGMDPIAKVQLVHSIGLLPLLASTSVTEMGADEQRQIGLVTDMVILELIGCWAKFEDTVVYARIGPNAVPSPKVTSRKGTPNSSMRDSPKSQDGSGESPESLLEIIGTVAQLLRVAVGIMLPLFDHGDVMVSSAVFPSCNRLIALLKQQSTFRAKIDQLFVNGGAQVPTSAGGAVNITQFLTQEQYFMAQDYLNALLMGIYKQLQYPLDFDFSGFEEGAGGGSTDDDDSDIVEDVGSAAQVSVTLTKDRNSNILQGESCAKREVRKLFVNCCRVHPERCLELVGAVLTALPQPISKAPFPPLEAALRLVHAFSECGPMNSKLVTEGTFPSLVRAIHGTDIAQHAHPQVLLSYFEISLRYVRLVDAATVGAVVSSLVGPHGLRCRGSDLIRNRSAYFVVKMAESMEGKSSQLLGALATPLSGPILLLTARSLVTVKGRKRYFAGRAAVSICYMMCNVRRQTRTSVSAAHDNAAIKQILVSNSRSPLDASNQSGRLTDAAELHLFETIGLMTSSTHQSGPEGEGLLTRQFQQKLLSDVTGYVVQQVAEVMANRDQLVRYVDQYTVFVAHKMNCLSSLAKGHNFKTHEHNAQYFDASAATVVSVLEALSQMQCVRSKAVVYMHRMVNSLGPRSLLHITQAVGVLLRHAESGSDLEETTLLLNQCMVEFGLGAGQLVQRYHGEVVDRYQQIGAHFENSLLAASGGATGVMEAPHIEAERVALQKQHLLYLQHVAITGCHLTLTSPEHVHRLEEMLSTVLTAIKGGRGGSSGAPISSQGGLPLRKGGIVVLVALIKIWCVPSPDISSELVSSASFVSVSATGSSLPAHLTAAFQSFLLDHAMPAMLASVSDGGRSVNVKDAAAQSVVVEIAAALWTLQLVLGAQAMTSYLSGVLTALAWGTTTQQTCVQQLTAFPLLGAYRETFKLFLRSA